MMIKPLTHEEALLKHCPMGGNCKGSQCMKWEVYTTQNYNAPKEKPSDKARFLKSRLPSMLPVPEIIITNKGMCGL